MNRPFKVGDVVVYNPQYADQVTLMRNLSFVVNEPFFPAGSKMVVKTIHRAKGSQSGWELDVADASDPDGVRVTKMDSDWFVKEDAQWLKPTLL